MNDCVCAEWIEEHSAAAAPLANYAPNHLETYRDPQVPPALPPGPVGIKSKFLIIKDLHFYGKCLIVYRSNFKLADRFAWEQSR